MDFSQIIIVLQNSPPKVLTFLQENYGYVLAIYASVTLLANILEKIADIIVRAIPGDKDDKFVNKWIRPIFKVVRIAGSIIQEIAKIFNGKSTNGGK